MLGTSITDVFKTAVTAPFKIASNPAVRSATLTALKNNQYTSSYASAADLADRSVHRDRYPLPPQMMPQQMPMMMEPPPFGPDGEPTSSPVQQGNLLLIGGVAVGALLLFMLMRK